MVKQAKNLPVTVKAKNILRLGVGTSYMLTDVFGLRAKLGWEGTKALRLRVTDPDDGTSTSYKAFKDSITVALGLFARF
jgi:hypothetical protein